MTQALPITSHAFGSATDAGAGVIPFNKPYLIGQELAYIRQCIEEGVISGNGRFTRQCEAFFEERLKANGEGAKKTFLTSSCTDALEMCAILLNLQPGDEVICPSYTFVTTANAFVLHGATVIFADSEQETPNIDVSTLEALITPRTKAIVAVHYAGVSCAMDELVALCQKHNLVLIEDAAHAVDSFYTGANGQPKPLGSFGQLATFSFHETKNIISGEGGLLVVNDPQYVQRAEVIREKGTNRTAFFRGEVDKYTWHDVGSSYLPADYVAAFLWAQLEHFDAIQAKRRSIWDEYHHLLTPLAEAGKVKLPYLPNYASNNAHMFYLQCADLEERTALISHLKANGVGAVFHYLPLDQSPFYRAQMAGRTLAPCPNAERYADTIVRLPFFYELTPADIARVCEVVVGFWG